MNTFFYIKVKKTGRYIVWCNDCWYETDIAGKPYTHDEAVATFDQLKKHYIYEVILEGSDGSQEELSAFGDSKKQFHISKNGIIVRKPKLSLSIRKKS